MKSQKVLFHQYSRNGRGNRSNESVLEVNGSTRQPWKKVCRYGWGVGGSDPYGERMGG